MTTLKMIELEERILRNIEDYNSSIDDVIEVLEILRLSLPIRIRDLEEAKYRIDKVCHTELNGLKSMLDSIYDNQTYLNELIVDELRSTQE